MATLDIRGHEVVSSVPFEPTIPVKKPFDISEYIRQQIMREKMAHDDEIRTEDDLAEDMLDFDEQPFKDGLLGPSPYEIGEDVPDAYIKPEPQKETETVSDVSKTEKASETPSEA